MEAKTNPRARSIDLNHDRTTRFAVMFANIRKDLGQAQQRWGPSGLDCVDQESGGTLPLLTTSVFLSSANHLQPMLQILRGSPS